MEKNYCAIRDILTAAATLGDLQLIKYMHYNYGGLCTNNFVMETAVMAGHVEIVQYLYGLDTEIHDKYLMHIALTNGSIDVVKYLHKHGVEIPTDNFDMLKEITYNGHVSVFEYLHQNGVNIQSHLIELLDVAIDTGHVSIVQYLCKNGAVFNVSDQMLRNVICRRNFEMFKFLYDLYDKTNIYILLVDAVQRNHLDITRYLLEQGDHINGDLIRLFGYIEYVDTTEMIDILLEHNIDIRKCSNRIFKTPIKENNIDMILFLLEKEANISGQQYCPLKDAASRNHTQIVRMILQYNKNYDLSGINVRRYSSEIQYEIDKFKNSICRIKRCV